MADLITPDNAVSFFQGLPRRIDQAARALEEDTEGTVGKAVTPVIDALNRLIHEIQSANYVADDATAEAVNPANLRPDLADRLQTGCTEAARGIAGVGQWEDAESRALLVKIADAVDEISGEVRQLQNAAERLTAEN